MGYVIIVTKNGKHIFQTSEDSIGYDRDLTKEVYNRINTAFPKSEGFDVEIVRTYSGQDNVDPKTL